MSLKVKPTEQDPLKDIIHVSYQDEIVVMLSVKQYKCTVNRTVSTSPEIKDDLKLP